MGLFKVMMIPTESKEDLKMLDSDLTYHIKMNRSKDLLLKIVKKFVTEIHRRLLKVAPCDPATCKEVVNHNQLIPETGEEFGRIQCMDVHPIETWVLVGHEGGNVCIWNYVTQERLMMFNVRDSPLKKWWSIIYSTKFIDGEQWFAAGDGSGLVHVYAYSTKDKMKEFEAHCSTAVSSLAVHPTDPLLLTASWGDKSIKLWDWGQGWVCTRVFDANDTVWQLTIGPQDTNTFASYSRQHTKVWDIHSLNNPIVTLEPSGETTFYSNSHRHFLVTTRPDGDNKAIIWDLLTKKHVHTLHVTRELHGDWVACHHNKLPILATIMALHGSGKKHVFFWDSRTYRLMKKVDFSMTGSIVCMVFDGTKDLTSLVVASTRGMSIIKINVLALLTHCWS